MKVRPLSVAALGTILLALGSVGAGAITQNDVDGLRAQIDAPGIDERGAVVVAGATLRAGPGIVTLRSGRIYPAQAVRLDQRTTTVAREYVFVGDGRLDLDPGDPVEAHQLEVFAGAPTVSESFRAAVLVIANDETAAALTSRPLAASAVAAPDGGELERARSLLDRWRSSPERRLLGVDEAIVADLLGDQAADDFFVGAFEGETLGRFLLSIEPRSNEPLAMNRFEPVELTDKERAKITRMVHHEQRRGRLLGVTEDSLGQWDSWLSMPLAGAGGARAPQSTGSAGFEPTHYEIDAEIASGGDALEGRARVSLRAGASGLRVASFDLHGDLQVSAAVEIGPDGPRPAPFLRADDRVSVVLDHAPEAGAAVEIELRYAGQAFDTVATGSGRSFLLRDSLLWYPHAGEEDLATYDVTLRWPRKWELLAVGTLVGEGQEGALRWQHRRVDRPTLGYTFQFGKFAISETRVGDLRLRVAIDAASQSVLTGRLALLDAAADSVRFFTGVFGPLPLDELVVVTSQQDFSQSMLGFVVLSLEMTRDDKRYAASGYEDPRTTIAHEVSHQWWGHLVSWRSYRDQWLSEALADYSSAFYARKHLPERASVWTGPLDDWEDMLEATAANGQSIESLGPVVLGERLESSLSEDAYQAIVYTKGALVLNTLAQRVGEDAFHSVLRGMAEQAAGRPVSTADFLAVVSRASGLDLGPFADAFVYGTGVPELEYSYRATPPTSSGDGSPNDGKWRLAIDVVRAAPFRFTYGVAPRPDGGLDVRREVVADALPSVVPGLGVPFTVTLRGSSSTAPQPAGRARHASATAARAARGVVVLEGAVSHVELEVAGEPETLTLDPDGILLARFFDTTRMDRGTLLRRGYQALARHDDGAQARFEQAIDADLGDAGAVSEDDRIAAEVLGVDANLELARLALDRGADSVAERRIAAAQASLERVDADYRPGLEIDVLVVESRLDLRRGDARGAARRLTRAWDDGWLEDGEGLLLLAIAARQSGNAELFAEALEAARRRRAEVVDLGPLLERKAARSTAP